MREGCVVVVFHFSSSSVCVSLLLQNKCLAQVVSIIVLCTVILL